MSSVNLKRQKEINAQMSQVMDDFDRFEFFFAEHWKKIVAAAVLIVLGVAAVVSFRVYSHHRQLTAAVAFNQAADVGALEKALARYGSAEASAAARLRLAGLYVDAKNYEGARRELQAVSGDSKVPELAWRATLNLGYLAELEGKFEEAAGIFAAFAAQTAAGSEGYRGEAFVNAGRLYLAAGKQQEAREILEAARSMNAGNSAAPGAQAAAMWMQQINFLLARLDAAPVAAK